MIHSTQPASPHPRAREMQHQLIAPVAWFFSMTNFLFKNKFKNEWKKCHLVANGICVILQLCWLWSEQPVIFELGRWSGKIMMDSVVFCHFWAWIFLMSVWVLAVYSLLVLKNRFQCKSCWKKKSGPFSFTSFPLNSCL